MQCIPAVSFTGECLEFRHPFALHSTKSYQVLPCTGPQASGPGLASGTSQKRLGEVWGAACISVGTKVSLSDLWPVDVSLVTQ